MLTERGCPGVDRHSAASLRRLRRVEHGGVLDRSHNGSPVSLSAAAVARTSTPSARTRGSHRCGARLATHPGDDTAKVRTALGKPRATVDRQLQALPMLGVLKVDEEETE